MSTTKTVYELVHEGEVDERLSGFFTTARRAAEGDSNDDEIQALNDLIDELLGAFDIKVEETEVPECDECDEEATNFWPELKKPVQLCDGCEHDARRSGWEPGR